MIRYLFPILILYLIIINAAGLILMRIDKRAAQKSAWRIPEATLLGIAIGGGCFGVYWGMMLFRHKTQKPRFTIGVPLIMAAYIMLFVGLLIAKRRI